MDIHPFAEQIIYIHEVNASNNDHSINTYKGFKREVILPLRQMCHSISMSLLTYQERQINIHIPYTPCSGINFTGG
jgi:hypothetical protein